MASKLRKVLNRFQQQSTPVSLDRMADDMNIELGVLHGMIDYWVRKGKLREINSSDAHCPTCGDNGKPSIFATIPRYYEVVNDEEESSTPSCGCGYR